MSVRVTSVAKKAQPWSEAAAAIHVITRDDIRRSGATSVPELLRAVPGVHVARIDATRYSVSIRGFSGRFSSNLLVLIDGRSIYTPLFSGVYWEGEPQGIVLADIERIEVIRGPGGTLWGANAVSGVVNIITRSATDTQGGWAQLQAGSDSRAAEARHGTRLGEAALRLYAKADDRRAFETTAGTGASDASRARRAGFRVDARSSDRDEFTLQGDVHSVRADQTVGISRLAPFASTAFGPDVSAFDGGNVLVRWRRQVAAESEWQLQGYVDRSDRRDAVLDARITTLDLEFQHRLPVGSSHELTWGLGYRAIRDKLDGSFTISFAPANRTAELTSAFIQDSVEVSDTLRATLGAKVENTRAAGVQLQPSARLAWRPAADHFFWGALSRALHAPSRADLESRLNWLVVPGVPFPTVFSNSGRPGFEPEKVVTAELGYRGHPSRTLTLDVTLFHNRHDALRSTERLAVSPPPPYVGVPFAYANKGRGVMHGAEFAALWQARPHWRIRAAASWLKPDFAVAADSTDPGLPARLSGSVPKWMYQLQSLHELGEAVDLSASWGRVGALSATQGIGGGQAGVPAFGRLDIRATWRPRPSVEVSVTGQNLLDRNHIEYLAQDVTSSAVPRSVRAELNWRF